MYAPRLRQREHSVQLVRESLSMRIRLSTCRALRATRPVRGSGTARIYVLHEPRFMPLAAKRASSRLSAVSRSARADRTNAHRSCSARHHLTIFDVLWTRSVIFHVHWSPPPSRSTIRSPCCLRKWNSTSRKLWIIEISHKLILKYIVQQIWKE